MSRVEHASDDAQKKFHSLARMVLKELALISTNELKNKGAILSDGILTDSMMVLQFVELLIADYKQALTYAISHTNQMMGNPASMREFLKDPDVRKIIKDMMDY